MSAEQSVGVVNKPFLHVINPSRDVLDSEGIIPEDMSAFSLFFRDMKQYRIPSPSEESRLGEGLFSGKLGLVGFEALIESGRLREGQLLCVHALRTDPVARLFSEQFQLHMNRVKKGEKDESTVRVFEEYREALRKELENLNGNEDELLAKKAVDNIVDRNVFMVKDAISSFNRLVNSNLPLVVSIAKKYLEHKGMSMEALVSFGNEGLMIAAAKFDFRMGNAFGTLATWWIRQTILRGIENEGLIRLPGHIGNKTNSIRRKYWQELQATGESDALIKAGPDVQAALKSTKVMYLSTPVTTYSSDVTPWSEYIADEEINVPDDVLSAERIRQVERLLDNLSSIQRDILRHRFGMVTGKEETLEETGRALGINREKVRKEEIKALERLRESPGVNSLRVFLERT